MRVDALSILVEFYSAQDVEIAHPYLAVMAAVRLYYERRISQTLIHPRFVDSSSFLDHTASSLLCAGSPPLSAKCHRGISDIGRKTRENSHFF